MAFDPIAGVKSALGVLGNIASGINKVSSLGAALTSGDSGKVLSAIRSINLPKGGDSSGGGAAGANATFVTDASQDWRARLYLPGMDDRINEVYSKGQILEPIRESKGLIFPYTPTITISHNVTYGEQSLTHQNYQFIAYQNSKVSDIQINGDFYVQDWNEALYWIAAVHFLRSVTKMYAGENIYVGNPPPILKFSAYGDYVFKNVPVVVKSFSVTLPKEVDYISADIMKQAPGGGGSGGGGGAGGGGGGGFGGSNLDKIGSNARLLSGIASAVGATTAGQVLNFLSNGASVSKVISGGIGGGADGGGGNTASREALVAPTHVPTQSQFNVTVTPVYSRTQVRQFNLEEFVKGGYKGQGYL
jgi:hypothetical protein